MVEQQLGHARLARPGRAVQQLPALRLPQPGRATADAVGQVLFAHALDEVFSFDARVCEGGKGLVDSEAVKDRRERKNACAAHVRETQVCFVQLAVGDGGAVVTVTPGGLRAGGRHSLTAAERQEKDSHTSQGPAAGSAGGASRRSLQPHAHVPAHGVDRVGCEVVVCLSLQRAGTAGGRRAAAG